MSNKSVIVRIPASTSNLGSGFDTLGLALRLYNRVRVVRLEGEGTPLVTHVTPEEKNSASGGWDAGMELDASENVDGPSPLKTVGELPEFAIQSISESLNEAAEIFFRRAEKPEFRVEFSLTGDVPFGRGLGASATARLGLIAALSKLSGANFTKQQLLDLVAELEGHPDNASPAIFGGLTVSGLVNGKVRCLQFPVEPKLKFVTLIPAFGISTEESRKLVPSTFSKDDTRHSLNRAAMVTAAFAAKKYELLPGLFDDRMHQPYREQLLPQLSAVLQAGEAAGASGGWLSGSGSAIICLALEKAEQV